ncbi:hypothetical protein BT93_E2890 [Corymbia citriodora subsp. variegata]|nr:hypothetical protein BT93_E2890 [Corymbia citriodora subsp. variegata]
MSVDLFLKPLRVVLYPSGCKQARVDSRNRGSQAHKRGLTQKIEIADIGREPNEHRTRKRKVKLGHDNKRERQTHLVTMEARVMMRGGATVVVTKV